MYPRWTNESQTFLPELEDCPAGEKIKYARDKLKVGVKKL